MKIEHHTLRPDHSSHRKCARRAWFISIGLHSLLMAALSVLVLAPRTLDFGDGRGKVLQLSAVPEVNAAVTDAPVTFVAIRTGASLDSLVQSAIASRQDHGLETACQELQSMARKLDRVSTVESVREVSRHIRAVMGLHETSANPDVSTYGFDYRSARVRQVYESSPEAFMVVLQDQYGNRHEAPLDPAAAHQLRCILQIIYEHPLLQAVYEDVVCQLINQLSRNGPQA